MESRKLAAERIKLAVYRAIVRAEEEEGRRRPPQESRTKIGEAWPEIV